MDVRISGNRKEDPENKFRMTVRDQLERTNTDIPGLISAYLKQRNEMLKLV